MPKKNRRKKKAVAPPPAPAATGAGAGAGASAKSKGKAKPAGLVKQGPLAGKEAGTFRHILVHSHCSTCRALS